MDNGYIIVNLWQMTRLPWECLIPFTRAVVRRLTPRTLSHRYPSGLWWDPSIILALRY